MKHFNLKRVFISLFIFSVSASANDQIIRPYQGIRSSGMGGVRITTGLYDENFFSNPARVTANPRFRLTLLDPMIEGNSGLNNTVQQLTKPSSTATTSTTSSSGTKIFVDLADTAGNSNHIRVQLTPFAFYVPTGNGKWAFAFAPLLFSTQADLMLSRNFAVDPQAVVDVGPALTLGRKFMEDDALSVGLTGHFIYRLSSTESISVVKLIQGTSIDPQKSAGQGAMVDFDLGGTYVLPVKYKDIELTTGASINNLLGGKYSNIGLKPVPSITGTVREQPRTLGLGISARRAELWKFTDALLAFELTDIGNNTNGSIFRLVHLGGEIRYGVLAPRLGINQGYFTAGLGFDLRFLTLDLATYGEELSLNPGKFSDRRYAMKLAFQIEGGKKPTAAKSEETAPVAPATPEPVPSAAPPVEPTQPPAATGTAPPAAADTPLPGIGPTGP